MQVLCRAAVLVLLGLSLGTSGTYAATTRSEVRPQTEWSAADRVGSWWNLVLSAWAKAGCGIEPWGRCVEGHSAQAPETKAGPGTDPLGRFVVNPTTQTPNTADAGCGTDPLGLCLPGH
jgi:hypothetical protein